MGPRRETKKEIVVFLGCTTSPLSPGIDHSTDYIQKRTARRMQRSVLLWLGSLYLLNSLCCTAQRCDTERVESDGRLFRSLPSGEVRSCRDSFVYELREDCGECRILKIGYAMATPCIADLEITFGGNRVEDARQATWIRSNNVVTRSGVDGSTDGFVGVFDGNAYIEVPLFAYSELGARVEVKIRYRESPNLKGSGVDMGLVSNSGQLGMFPTFAIIHSLGQNAILGALNTTGGSFVQFNIPQPETVRYDWKTVTFDYNALANGEDRAMLILEQPNAISRSDVIGNIKALQTPLVIGKGAFFESFQGEIDFIRISRCSPVTRSRIN